MGLVPVIYNASAKIGNNPEYSKDLRNNFHLGSGKGYRGKVIRSQRVDTGQSLIHTQIVLEIR